jgi:hypothetical protein
MRAVALPALALSLGLGACSMDRITPKTDFSSFEWNPYSKASSMTVVSPLSRAPATAADFINADGSCAGGEAAEASTEPVPTAIALQTTECAVVRALGMPEKIDIGANERGDRVAKLLYSSGARPGLYHFTAGHLKQIDRVAEPPPPKPQKPPAKPRRNVT